MRKNKIKLAILKEFLRKNNAYELYRYNMLRYFNNNLLGIKRNLEDTVEHHYSSTLSRFFDWDNTREGRQFWSRLSDMWRIEINTRVKEWE